MGTGARVNRRLGWRPSSIEPQCRHLMAASWISSAQKGQVFMGSENTTESLAVGKVPSVRRL